MQDQHNIFSYNNFRQFLMDSYEFRRKSDAGFTKAHICRVLGLPNSRSYFQDVLNGKFVSDIKIPLFSKLFGLSQEEANYFLILVKFNQCDNPEEKELLLDQLISLNRTPQKIISKKAYAYYKEWRHSAIKAALEVIDFDGNYTNLAKKMLLKVSTKQARSSIKLLKELGLIRKNEVGKYKPTDKVLSTGAFAQDAIIRQFQLKCLDSARLTLLCNKKQPERMLTKTISISEEGYKKIEKHIEKFSSEIRSIVHKDESKPDRVYQLDVVLVPLLRKKES
jgi:uncharacterized protein (TIGR02147 family)